MKFSLTSLAAYSLAVAFSSASVTITNEIGIALDSSDTAVADGTLWVLIVDSSNDDTILGTALNDGISVSSANSFFNIGDSIDVGSTFAGDTVFAMGGFGGQTGGDGGLGITNDQLPSITYGGGGTGNGVAAGLDYMFVFFPGVQYDASFGGAAIIASNGGTSIHTVGNQVGAFNYTTNTDVGYYNDGMVLPSDGSTVILGAASTDYFTGTGDPADFTAVDLVPEPSSALLAALGGLALLRRRRRD